MAGEMLGSIATEYNFIGHDAKMKSWLDTSSWGEHGTLLGQTSSETVHILYRIRM